jgi:hypothetical protein
MMADRGERTVTKPLHISSMLLIAMFSCMQVHALPVDEVKRAQAAQKAQEKNDKDKATKTVDEPKTKKAPATRVQRPASATTSPPVPPVLPPPFADEVDRYVDVFAHQGTAQQIKACNELEFAGLSDPRLIDLIENKLAQRQTVKDGDDVAYATALMHALAYSGQERYRNALKAVADGNGHRKLRKQAAAIMKELDNYKSWTPIIGNPADYRRDKSPDINRLANMLRGSVASLQMLAARRMVADHQYDPYLLEVTQQSVSSMLGAKSGDAEDALVWMLRALAEAHSTEARSVLQEAAEHAASKQVRKHAASYLKKYD